MITLSLKSLLKHGKMKHVFQPPEELEANQAGGVIKGRLGKVLSLEVVAKVSESKIPQYKLIGIMSVSTIHLRNYIKELNKILSNGLGQYYLQPLDNNSSNEEHSFEEFFESGIVASANTPEDYFKICESFNSIPIRN